MAFSALDRLRSFLRPAGNGIYTVSTGFYARALQEKLYGNDISTAWEDGLSRIRRVKAVVIGIPSDTGAGIRKGANFGPIGIREAFLNHRTYPKDCLDLGDIICIPHLLEDSMLCETQKKDSRTALYGPDHANDMSLPVSPLSLMEATLAALFELNPKVQVYVLGGDHSVSWPVVNALVAAGKKFAILHFDAHSDLLEHRLGVHHCFGTWAFHAMKLLPPHALVQVGIRSTRKSKAEWEALHPIKQFWANEIEADEKGNLEKILNHFRDLKLPLYISNDIDGTDMSFAPATGTPEAKGLRPGFVKGLIQKCREEFEIIGGDIVEVAPPLSGSMEFKTEPTCLLAADYLHSLL